MQKYRLKLIIIKFTKQIDWKIPQSQTKNTDSWPTQSESLRHRMLTPATWPCLVGMVCILKEIQRRFKTPHNNSIRYYTGIVRFILPPAYVGYSELQGRETCMLFSSAVVLSGKGWVQINSFRFLTEFGAVTFEWIKTGERGWADEGSPSGTFWGEGCGSFQGLSGGWGSQLRGKATADWCSP